MGGAKVQNTANPVQRGSTSANNSDGACATITAGQQSFQVNCSVCIFFFSMSCHRIITHLEYHPMFPLAAICYTGTV